MLPEIKFWPVNWVDGMKVSDRHFIQQEQSFTDRLRDYAAIGITNFNYGLLLPAPGMRSSLEFTFQADQAKLIRVKVSECRAITPAGARIEISSRDSKALQFFHKEIETDYKIKSVTASKLDIVIVVNPFVRVPSGSADPEETPTRSPFTLPECRLEIIPSDQINQNEPSAFNITIGKINVVGDDIALDESYIPPSTAINCYKLLEEQYQLMTRQLFEMGASAMIITQKIKSEPKRTDLANNVMYLAEKVLSYLSMVIPQHRMTVSQGPPVLMFEKLSSLGYVISAAVNSIPDKEKEKMFNYFKQWTELSQSQFEGSVMSVMNIEYNHLDISKSLYTITRFVTVIAKLFKQLSKLKYIGEQKDSGIVIGETIEPPVRPERPVIQEQERKNTVGGWGFLMD